MKIKLVLRDVEYRKAIAKALTRAGSDIYLEVGRDFRQEDRTLILTDIKKEYPGTGFIYLNPVPGGSQQEGNGPYSLFKYEKISSLLSQIRFCYYLWTGEGEVPAGTRQMAAVCCDRFTEQCTEYARALARELIYRYGSRVLILSLSHVNQYGTSGEEDGNVLRQLLYCLERGRDIPMDAFFVKDRYDLYTFRAPYGRNPIAYMDVRELLKLLGNLAGRFDTVLLDVGNCYTPANLHVLEHCKTRIFLSDDPGPGILRDYLKDAAAERVILGEDWELTIADHAEKLGRRLPS